MTTTSPPGDADEAGDAASARERILDAAFEAFMEHGYASTSTLEIATRARVSKRELYTLVGNKQAILVAAISARATRMQMPADVPVPHDREGLAQVLSTFGAQTLREITDPSVVAVFRLAIAEAAHAPEVARTLDAIGRETVRAAVRQIMARARTAGLLAGNPVELAEQFGALLWGNVMIDLLLGVAEPPSAREAAARARIATEAFMQLHPSAIRAGRNTRKA